MAYKVNYTETIPAKPPLNVPDGGTNTDTSLTFVGKNYSGYGQYIAENFLHLLENFAKGTAPANPVQGQLWYDNTPGVNLLKIYDGTTWTAAGAVKKAGNKSELNNNIIGDLWIDTSNQQLYIWSGSGWLLVGPQYSSGTKTGPLVESITDTSNVSHSVISNYSNDQRVSIQSYSAFTPKTTISGFSTIGRGITLTTNSYSHDGVTDSPKFWGTASVADALNYNGTTVQAANFLRGDQQSNTNYPINIRSNGGVSVGTDLSFNIGATSTSATLYSLRSGSSIELLVNNSGAQTTAVHINSNAKVGIGPNNASPQEVLDVLGNALVSGSIYSKSTTDSTALGVGSIKTDGGLSVLKSSNFGADVNVFGNIYLNNLDLNDDPVAGAVILPQYTNDPTEATTLAIPLATTPLYDLGSTTRKFRNIYSDTFIGNFTGTFTTTTTINGSVSGSAARLAGETTFRIGDSLDPLATKSDVTSNVVSFNGSGDDPVIFTATITPDFITNKDETTESILTDYFLVYRSGASGGLRKMSKQTLVNTIALVPVGTIMPFAGTVPPNGYLFCDGSELIRNEYLELFTVIGFTYKPAISLQGSGTFALPDLRGRFALGRDDMDNGIQVPSADNPDISIYTKTGRAFNVVEDTAKTVGGTNGSQYRTLDVSNLPDHKHNLNSGLQQYFAAGLPAAGPDANAYPGYGMPESSTGSGLPNSGGVDAAVGRAFDTMNPYLTINYIIFTGVL